MALPELVNPVPPEEIDGWSRTMASTFLGNPNDPSVERRARLLGEDWQSERAWGARAGGRWVATLRTEARLITVPGRDGQLVELTADAVTNVTVAATHRRRGLLRRMLTGSLAAARERGEPLSILIAAEWPIYGRFGYAPAIWSCDYALRSGRAGSAPAGDPSRLRDVGREEAAALAPAIFTAARRCRAGMLDRPGPWWDRVIGANGHEPPDGSPQNWLVHESADGPDGLIGWTAAGHAGLIPPYDTAHVGQLVAAGDTAYRNLWAYVAGLDLVDELQLKNRPVDEPVRWLLPDARTLVVRQHVDFVWLRLLDVPAALAARDYATAGELVLEVVDDEAGGFAAGRYRLSIETDGAAGCEPTDHAPDIRLHQRALASIYLGGNSLAAQRIARTVEECKPGAVQRADAMFATALAPWNPTWF